MKRKFQESAADYFYQKIEGLEDRIRSLNSSILNREEERDISLDKVEELTELIEKMDEFIESMYEDVNRLTRRLQRCKKYYFYYSYVVKQLHRQFTISGHDTHRMN